MTLRSLAGLFLLSVSLGLSLGQGQTVVKDGYTKVGFDRLSNFQFIPPYVEPGADPNAPVPTGEEQIPEPIKELNGSKIIVGGFMLPVKVENGLVTELLLMRDASACCYGTIPNMNEWIIVRMGKNGIKAVMDTPVYFYGTLKVGAVIEEGYLAGIYVLEGDKMDQEG
ncbi:hypothetical protein MASR2M8_04800 [Opitutaceae bacterium]